MTETATEKKKVLIVDDEAGIRILYDRELRKEGYEVLHASSGPECLRLVEEEKPDIVVLDIRMPGMDGIQVLHRILEADNELPVVINTAYSSYRDNFMTWVANAYLIKSSDLTELKNTIRALLD
ncbi:MAG: response regulator [Planctomycetes bacterium]|nr:response regulator [Planctomycetota bacterium]